MIRACGRASLLLLLLRNLDTFQTRVNIIPIISLAMHGIPVLVRVLMADLAGHGFTEYHFGY
jgi:hypothetical protein